MCGIVGFLDKRGGADRPIGKTLLAMLQALSCRGPDSAGVALYRPIDGWDIRVSIPGSLDTGKAIASLNAIHGLRVKHHYANGVYDAAVAMGTDTDSLEAAILERLPGTEVICLGQRLDLFKQVGSPDQLEATYRISEKAGAHGIGHTRLSTESKVDLSHSQPFWAHGVPDLATVHNGHITNYHKLRRHYEQRGYRFYTDNDSEVIGIYLRDRLATGLPLVDCLRSSLDDFDGSFSYLVATAHHLAYVRDSYGFKPLIVAETDDFVAIATEEIALRKALGRNFAAREPAPGTMRLWNVAPTVAQVSQS